MGDLGVQVSIRSSVRPSVSSSIRQHLLWVSCERNSSYSFVPIVLKLCMRFCHGMMMCIWIGFNCQLFLSLFPLCELGLFLTSLNRQSIPCERNSYNFIPIVLKLCTCFFHDQKMCMWFGYNSCFNFCYFIHFANFVIS